MAAVIAGDCHDVLAFASTLALVVRLDLSEVTFNRYCTGRIPALHFYEQCLLACLLAAVCEVYADPVWASSATFYAWALAMFTDGPLCAHKQQQQADRPDREHQDSVQRARLTMLRCQWLLLACCISQSVVWADKHYSFQIDRDVIRLPEAEILKNDPSATLMTLRGKRCPDLWPACFARAHEHARDPTIKMLCGSSPF